MFIKQSSKASMNLFVLLIIFSAFSYSNSMMNDAHQGSNIVDRVALLAFKSEIAHDPHGVLSNWNESVPHCEWYGVTCGAKVHLRVVDLTLESEHLVGTLSPFVGNLSFLHHLDLFNNTFQGHIPTQIGHLHRLRSLVLESNTFTGLIPSNISRCSNLRILDLAANNLSGTIPPQLSHLTNLRLFNIFKNKFIGNLFNIVVNMTSLKMFQATSNFFEGNIPQSIGQFKNLVDFTIAENKISGSIPTSLYNLSSLQSFDVQNNQLEGTIPLDIGFLLPELRYLGLSANFFHGHVPNSISNLTHIEQLQIYSNNFTGKFKLDATHMPNLDTLDISTNFLGVGEAGDLTFLESLYNCSQLRLLILFSNNFGGELPLFQGNWSAKLKVIQVSQNHITGKIPTGLFNLVKSLVLLDLEQNQLSGNIPPEIGNAIELEQFTCRHNNLLGSIPHSIGNLSKLSELSLDGNNLEGSIPSSLGDCTNLLYLYLQQNNLTGLLPSHLFQASMLVDINLSLNHLQGTIPQEVGQLKNLEVLGLSTNAFTGNIPSSLSSCVYLDELVMDNNFFTGPISLSLKSLINIELLDLSHNRFSGEISFLSNFSLVELDLSYNNFEGEVPQKGIFRNASAVSVSGNPNLCGGIHELHLPRCPPKNATKLPKRRRLSHHVVVAIIAISCLAISASIVAFVFLFLSRRKKKGLQEPSLKEALPKVSYNALHKGTNGFSEANLVGTGHFGCVYKGILDQEGTVVAVKVIKVEEEGASKSFLSECKALRNTRHRNLVKIVTVCSSTDFKGNDFKALVYEFMPNGNLEQWIHEDRTTLSLEQRLNISIDVANAVDYLHNGCETPIIHCDLKPSNILLDDQMVAHVGDFGLVRFLSNSGTSATSSVLFKGTVGYAAPEYGVGSMASKEGDVYSYGIVLIELMTAIKPTDSMFSEGLNLHQYAKLELPDRLPTIVDEILCRDYVGASHGIQDKHLKCIKAVIETGLKCSAESPQDRISMEDVVRELQTIRNKLLPS